MGNRVVYSYLVAALLAFTGSFAQAGDPDTQCQAYGRPLAVNNQQVLHWKRTTPNQFKERANVQGRVVRIFPDRNGHDHFEIQIGSQRGDVIELVYNQDFGILPDRIMPGMEVQACGDYITSTAQSGPYPPSPSGAIVHWLHVNPRGNGHEHGFLMIQGTVFGLYENPARDGGKRKINEVPLEASFHSR